MAPVKLFTTNEWDKFPPSAKGYWAYMEGNLPGSELKGLRNPYADGTEESKSYAAGEFAAMVDAQDSEE